jgi:hypothetical protein
VPAKLSSVQCQIRCSGRESAAAIATSGRSRSFIRFGRGIGHNQGGFGEVRFLPVRALVDVPARQASAGEPARELVARRIAIHLHHRAGQGQESGLPGRRIVAADDDRAPASGQQEHRQDGERRHACRATVTRLPGDMHR